MPTQLKKLGKEMTKTVVDRVCEITGGPVSELKVFRMLENERKTNINNDIDDMQKRIHSFLDNKVINRIDGHDHELKVTNDFISDMDR